MADAVRAASLDTDVGALFRDRRDAGRRLARRLEPWRDRKPLVLAMPRGGVPVGDEVARALGAELDVLVVRKIGVPRQPELAAGALGPDRVVVWNHDVLAETGLLPSDLKAVVADESRELSRRLDVFRREAPPLAVAGRVVLIVDDGIATGASARAALQWARAAGADEVVLAVPVATPDSVERLSADADAVVAAETPAVLWSVGAAYDDFEQTDDAEVVAILDAARGRGRAALPSGPPVEREVSLRTTDATLAADLVVPSGAKALVLFAHGSGSGRKSTRNRAVARALEQAGLATMLLDLLTAGEAAEDERTRQWRFDIPLLGQRVTEAVDALLEAPATKSLAVGIFGASTGAAAALIAAANRPDGVAAVVSRGGRPDLVEPEVLERVRAPTLFVVGGDDHEVLEMNRDAYAHLRGERRLDVVPGASHLFEEPGALEKVTQLARDWFLAHRGAVGSPGR